MDGGVLGGDRRLHKKMGVDAGGRQRRFDAVDK
jgi:hypothetical protein